MTEVTRGFCWHQNVVPWVLSATDLRLYTFIKSWKDVYKVRGGRDVIRPFCFHKKKCPQGFFCPLVLGLYMHVWKKTKISYKILRQKGSFCNWYKTMGIIKVIKCCQNVYQVVYAHALGLYTCLKLWKCANFLSLPRTRSSCQVSATGPLVLWFNFLLF